MTSRANSNLVCVTSSHPASAVTSGGGSLTIICPHTGSIQSTLRLAGDTAGHKLLGISTLSLFPRNMAPMAVAFGNSVTNPEDSYAMLLSIKSHNSVLHWKSRLPEGQLTGGLLASPCGHYILGGGRSGLLYVWKAVEGLLLNTFQAHYQAITVMEWCHGFLVTGGADGMVNAFALSHIASPPSMSSTTSSQTCLRSWSQHHLTITALAELSSGRLASASQDGRVQIVELSSESVLASWNLESGVTSLVFDSQVHRLFMGTQEGVVHLIDLNEYALYQTRQSGAKVAVSGVIQRPVTQLEQVFGAPTDQSTFQSQLRGHDRAITSIQVVDDNLVMSADEAGCLRVWDVSARICLRVLRPWSTAASGGNGKNALVHHPVTSIRVLQGKSDSDESSASHLKEWIKLLLPLQKYVEPNLSTIQVFLRPKRSRACEEYWQIPTSSLFDVQAALRKRQINEHACGAQKCRKSDESAEDSTDSATIQRLKEELAQAKQTIQRWEVVNNKLVARLKK